MGLVQLIVSFDDKYFETNENIHKYIKIYKCIADEK